jgi:hypothetical protein
VKVCSEEVVAFFTDIIYHRDPQLHHHRQRHTVH